MSDSKQRVLLVTRSLMMGGVEKNTVNLANTLHAMGHEVHVLSLKRRHELLPGEGVHMHFVDFDKQNRLTGIGLIYDLLTRIFLAPFIPGSGFVWRGFYGGLFMGRFVSKLEQEYGPVDRIIVRGQGGYEHIWNYRPDNYYQVVVCPLPAVKGGWLEGWYTRLLYKGKKVVANSTGVMDSLKAHLERQPE